MANLTLLITATIKPINTPQVAITDFSQRESQYIAALKEYLLLRVPVVFVENSNTHSEKIKQLILGRSDCEYLTFQSTQSSKGKGHGEMEIIEYALAHSTLINNSRWIVKITGRHRIGNIHRILDKVKGLRGDVLVNWGLNLTWADTRIMMVSKDFINRYLMPVAQEYLDEKNRIYLENVFARSIHLYMKEGGVYEPWPEYPFYIGYNGTTGQPIRFGFFRRLKFRIYFRFKRWFFKQLV